VALEYSWARLKWIKLPGNTCIGASEEAEKYDGTTASETLVWIDWLYEITVTGKRGFCPWEGSCFSRLPDNDRLAWSYFNMLNPETSMVRLMISAGCIDCALTRTPAKSAGEERVTLKGVEAVTLIVGSEEVVMDNSCDDMARSKGSVDAVYPSWSDTCNARDKVVLSFGVIPFTVRAL
jgi:hypothetical protein